MRMTRFQKILFLTLIFISVLWFDSYPVSAKEEPKELKILVIEINPYLKTKGMKVSEYFSLSGEKQDVDESIRELKEDIEYSSNGVVKCTIVAKEYLNEFPRYTQLFTLSYIDETSGQRIIKGKDYQLDEDTYLDIFKKGWYGWWNTPNPVVAEGIDKYPFKFDYQYLIDKFDLIKRRNNHEFDMVWLFGIDPLSMGEINVVGRSPFWVNGDTIKGDCENFVLFGFTLSRKDSMLECVGHLAESMLNYVYGVTDEAYNKPLVFNHIDELNTWQKFYLCKHKAPTNYTTYGVGQIHFAPNSRSDYDWANNTPVYSTWEDWKYNYPNLTGMSTVFTADVYRNDNFSDNRAHKRWWLSLMPHVPGRDKNGYSHNWWEYITSLDFVKSISVADSSSQNQNNGEIELESGKTTELKFKLHYFSGKQEDFIIKGLSDNVRIDNEKVIAFENGKMKAIKEGTARITLMLDGKEAHYQIKVKAKTDEKAHPFLDVGQYWATDGITWAYQAGIIYGTGDNLFLPSKNVTEAEFLAMLCRMCNIPVRQAKSTDTHWAQPYYDAVREYELPLRGYDNSQEGNQAKNAELNRGDIAKLIAAKNGFNLDLKAAVDYMYENELSNGTNPNMKTFESYGVNEKLHRDQAVTFLFRVYHCDFTTNKVEKSDVAGGQMRGIKGKVQ